ncbi:MAG: hypothetical protein H6584_05910 [Flavobacteriales bacterium]|nr:hypothetical protein [Flavobacteriales bacterium]
MNSNFIKALVIGGLIFTSCDKDDENVAPVVTVQKTDVVSNYADIVLANYEDALADAKSLDASIQSFTAQPTEASLKTAKDAWLKSRESYGQTEAFRFANGPIDDADGPEGLLNAWPLDENYIDYVTGKDDSGIINNPTDYPAIDAATLESLNEAGSETNISIGYHAIEFLLWGQDNTAPSEKKAGLRPYTDFVDGGTAKYQGRRRDYLKVCSGLLIKHLQMMVDEWKVGGPYRKIFLAQNSDTAIKNMLTAIAILSKSELGGERMFVAYDNQDQEDEHSCFSDNTHRDIRQNLAGIANVFRGKYGTVDGKSIEDLILVANPMLGAKISNQLVAAEQAVEATAVPFDFAISDATERAKVLAAVKALQDLGDKFVEGGTALGLTISSELPE